MMAEKYFFRARRGADDSGPAEQSERINSQETMHLREVDVRSHIASEGKMASSVFRLYHPRKSCCKQIQRRNPTNVPQLD